jgi:glycosyltransferase involved in cell wall biosynthesis
LKVLFAVWNTDLCGGVRAIFEIANGLRRRSYDVRIVALGGNHRWHHVDVPIDYIELNGSLRVLDRWRSQMYRMWKLRGKLDPMSTERVAETFGFHSDLMRILTESLPDCDVCVATWYPTALPVWISGKGKPYYLMQDFPEQLREISSPYGLPLFERTLELPFYFLTNSVYTKELVLERQKNPKIKVIGVGVDNKMFCPRNPETFPSKGKRIMAILKEPAFKGAEVAIRALNELNRRISVHAILVGDLTSVKRTPLNFQYTHFERVDDNALAELYSSSDAFLFTSHVEGFGLPPLEAMSCGTPVITTDCKGNRDYAMDQRNCLVIPPGDHNALADALMKVVTDDRLADQLRVGGLKTAKIWTWNRVVDELEETLKQ